MENFSPDNLAEAYRLLAHYCEDAVPIAGSSFFMGHREDLFDEVQVVINIKRLGLSYIELDDGGLTIGATTTLNEIFFSELCRQGAFRVFSETVPMVAVRCPWRIFIAAISTTRWRWVRWLLRFRCRHL